MSSMGMDFPGRKRRLTAYKFFMKACIKELKERYPGKRIVLPMVSRLCAQRWKKLDEKMKLVFRIEAEQCEEQRFELGLDDYLIEIPEDILKDP